MRSAGMWVPLCAAGLVSACGGSNSDDDLKVDYSLESSLVLNELTDAQAQQLCDEQGEYMARVSETLGDEVCVVNAIDAALTYLEQPGAALAGARKACREAYDACLESAPEEAQPEGCAFALQQVDATVGDLERCNAANPALVRVTASVTDCDRLLEGVSQSDLDRLQKAEADWWEACSPVFAGTPTSLDCGGRVDALPASWVCDGAIDCAGGEDEEDCAGLLLRTPTAGIDTPAARFFGLSAAPWSVGAKAPGASPVE